MRTADSHIDLDVLDTSRLHRPQTRDEMRCAAVELAQRGLTPRDIAQALELSEAVVRALLGA